ncbi:binding-protein-dependent transport protein [Purpureocillium lilacinum]|uniref:Binding-protein-dependent transport protein n=1 Tax=Purpureocillium lilacinum TaxID=33203 RepID=A0A179HDN7_PURLI|nr:periplasmic binding protein domain-containing protein [Purpureocillium lilacinum]PWI71632.1 binding-protein-dependent transport protein [Purpureocillium lilacinum]GJN66255.1 hypothetical protein PLICBS_000272 [Purpureocillium lilacinum]
MSSLRQPPETGQSSTLGIRIGALAPLSRPGWIDAGRHLLAGLELAVEEVNNSGGVSGKPLELLVRDTAADATKAAAAVDELAGLGVVALAGEYHSVVARAVAARADAIGLPYLCSSAVLDQLTEQPTNWVARLAPAQSHCWSVYADYLLSAGHSTVAIAADPTSVYWASGTRILRERLTSRGGTVIVLNVRELTPKAMCDELTRGENRATAVLLLVSQSSTASEIVEAVSGDERLTGTFMGAPAGQPELADWAMAFGKHDGTATPFLRYMPESLGHRGARVEAALREKLTEAPSFVAFEGYDTILVLAELLRTHGTDRTDNPPAWSDIAVDGSRGHISFSRIPGISVWQWAWPPIEVVDRDPAQPDRFRTLHMA